MKEKKPLLFRIINKTIKIFYRKVEVIGVENIPNDPSIFVANHVKMNGPLISHYYFPKQKKIWCIGELMNRKEASKYCYQDFWSHKPKIIRPIYKLLSYVAGPLFWYVMSNADAIPVYKDFRLTMTFRKTIQELNDNNHIIIFPEHREQYNEIINDFMDKYIDVAKLYYKKEGKILKFVPMYNAPLINKLIIGNPIEFNGENDINEERKRINDYLKEEITKLAKSLPRHKVIPYDNIRKRHFKWSKEK